MSFLHPLLLSGLALTAIPVILHLLLRQKPKKLLFPALRLIQHRRKQNVKRLRLKHLLLLLLRIAIIGVLVFAIARPSVPAADYSLNLRETVTLVGVLGVAVAIYFLVMRKWRRQEVPRHELRYRRSRLRGWLAGGALLLLALTVLWPYQRRVAAEIKSPAPAGDLRLPVAGVFLFDTSLSMQYRQAGQTRLDVAREVALEHMSELPTGSRIAVADTSTDHPILFQTTLGNAKARMEASELKALSLPLNDRILTALRLHEDDRKRTLAEQAALPSEERKDRYLRRIYVFTDLAESAWRPGGSSRLAAELERLQSVNLFLIDVSVPHRKNLGLTAVQPSRLRVPIGGELTLSATVTSEGADEVEQTVDLLLSDGRREPIKVAQQSFTPQPGTQRVEFGPLVLETGPVVHGEIRLVASDPLAFDDVRYFTVEVREAAAILLVSPDEAHVDDAFEWRVAVESAGYATSDLPAERLSAAALAGQDVVCLINVPSLPDETWYQLGQYVADGGGLAVFLGSTQLKSFNYNRQEPQVYLPAALRAYTARVERKPYFLSFIKPEHPVIRPLEEDDGIAILEATDINRFWKLERLADESNVLAEYTDEARSPALIERRSGRGRVVMLTTAVDLQGYAWRWNNLPNPQGDVWPFLVFADQLMRYLSGASDVQLNYLVSETPVLGFAPSTEERRFLLQRPQFRQSRLMLPAHESQLAVDGVDDVGRYSLRPEESTTGVIAGFSVNTNANESDFTPVEGEQLDQMLGEGRYQVARGIGELKEEINIADLGRELFPLLLAVAITVFCGEHLVANRFYEEEGTGKW